MKRLYYTGIGAFLFLLFFAGLSLPAEGAPLLVTEVHDGDTVSVKVKSFAGIPLKIERVRLIGIDAPELRQEPWGRRTKRHLKKIISESNWVVNVEFDLEERDRHGRLLAYLWAKDGRMINERMIEEGYALLYTVPPNVKYAERFIAAQKKAQLKKAGMWKEGGLKQTPEEWRREHPRV